MQLVFIIITIFLLLLFLQKINRYVFISSFIIWLTANIGYFIAITKQYQFPIPKIAMTILMSIVIFFLLLLFLFVQVIPTRTQSDISLRVKIVYGGKVLIDCLEITVLIQILLVLLAPQVFPIFSYSFLFFFSIGFITFLNGWWRIFIFSSRLRVLRRVIICLLNFVPVVNLFVLWYMQHLAVLEYDNACYMLDLATIRKDQDICETKYPLLLLHGIGFRDARTFNYWGRIPKHLKKNGATIYYGHQEAFGSVEDNGKIIQQKILDILTIEQCKKVNIIAHSKGGLDARYAISTLGMGEYVASLTTISTPHRGSYLADFATKWVPQSLYLRVAKIADKWFSKLGDSNPQFYYSTQQLTSNYLKKFNEENHDVAGVYYQSYASVMKNIFSHGLLSVPYLLMTVKTKDSDGLVQLESAKWGEFQKVFRTKYTRGISHGDVIDLAREDYKGFNVLETYVEIVSKLKARKY